MALQKIIFRMLILSLLFFVSACAHRAAPIGVVAAMPSEFEMVKQNLVNQKITIIDGVQFIQGDYQGNSIVLVASGIGKVNAAAMTSMLATQFHPRFIFNVGIAGALNSKVKPGDVVISNQVCELEHQEVGPHPSSDDINPNTGLPNQALLQVNPQLLSEVKSVVSNNSKVIVGGVVTTDIFPDVNQEEYESLFRANGIAVDMEGYAVFKIAHLFHIPCLIVRGISNPVEKNSQEVLQIYHHYKNEAEAQAVRVMLSLMVEQICDK